MEFLKVIRREGKEQEKKLFEKYDSLDNLIIEMEKKEIPDEIINSINIYLKEVNSFSGEIKPLIRFIKKNQYKILKLIEKELQLVVKKHYLTMWMALGMAIFGIPMGVAFGASLGNMAFLGIGLPIGMSIGIAIGTTKDKKAEEEGKQLDIEMSF